MDANFNGPGYLRHFYAGQALIGILGSMPQEQSASVVGSHQSVHAAIAEAAFKLADAMVAEAGRGKKSTTKPF